MRLKGVSIAFISLYLISGQGLSQDNLEILAEIRAFVKFWQIPFIIGGDFNLPPEDLIDSGFEVEISGEIRQVKTPDGEALHTCTSGSGRVLDYFIVATSILAATSQPEIDLTTPWRPHSGIELTVHRTPRALQARLLAAPASLNDKLAGDECKTRGITWEEASRITMSNGSAQHKGERTECHTSVLDSIPVYKHNSTHIANLDQQYAEWSAAAEEAILQKAGLLSESERRGFTGRGENPRLRVQPLLPLEAEAFSPKQAAAHFWATTIARLSEYSTHSKRGNGYRQSDMIHQFAISHLEPAAGKLLADSPDMDPEIQLDLRLVKHALSDVKGMTLDYVQRFIKIGETNLHKAEAATMGSQQNLSKPGQPTV
jgi:hypothetical protein